jgi:hypothetical protein
MKFSWWLVDRGQRKPRSDSMTGPGLLGDSTCTCGWDSATGGKPMGTIRAMVNDHKAEHGVRFDVAGEGAKTRVVQIATELTPQDIELMNARALIDQIDRMPASEGVKAIGTERAQRALELVGKAAAQGLPSVALAGAETE